MEFYIGGYAQGKREYVMQVVHQGETLRVLDGSDVMETEWDDGDKAAGNGNGAIAGDDRGKAVKGERVVLDHLHLWVKKMLEEGKNPEREVAAFVEKHGDCIVVSDEVGNGIVPMGRQEREYRERLGRIQIELAAKAERVERVICGIGQRIK